MVEKTPVIGNLALAPSWDRLSDTESDCSFELESETSPIKHASGQALGNLSGTAGFRFGTMTVLSGTQAPSQLGLDLYEADIIVGDISSQGAAFVAVNNLQNIVRVDEWASCSVYSTSTEDEARLLPYVMEGVLTFTSHAKASSSGDRSGTSTCSLAGSFPFLVNQRTQQSDDGLDVLGCQIKKLHNEFAQWPGSYNQLLLAGSIDYCRSVITKAKKSQMKVHEEVSKAIEGYYSLCLGIFDQYRDAKVSLRRLNLQSVQDSFDILQSTCARYGVYPRLADLDIEDIPLE